MEPFQYVNGRLHADGVDLAEVAARFGTPVYVYSRSAIEQAWRAFDGAVGGVPHLVCYAVKANSNLAVLDVLARLGSGFDIVSVGELERVLAAGGDPAKVVFSGVGKAAGEMRRALEVGIRCFNVESEPELRALDRIAGELGTIAPVSIRINPDVDPQTHPYIATGLRRNKFGIPMEDAEVIYQRAVELPHLSVKGVDCHIGSQLTSLEPVGDALSKMMGLCDRLAAHGIDLHEVDVGGGLGIRYRDEVPPSIEDYGATIVTAVGGRDLEVVLEPGRAVCANAGALLTRVEYLKRNAEHTFAIVDAAMNDYIRPALYDAWSNIIAVQRCEEYTGCQAPGADATGARDGSIGRVPPVFDVVGPVCETGDFLGWQRRLDVAEGDVLAVLSAGAYGFVMSSNYNSRPRAAEVMVDSGCAYVVRDRECIVELFAHEHCLPASLGAGDPRPGSRRSE